MIINFYDEKFYFHRFWYTRYKIWDRIYPKDFKYFQYSDTDYKYTFHWFLIYIVGGSLNNSFMRLLSIIGYRTLTFSELPKLFFDQQFLLKYITIPLDGMEAWQKEAAIFSTSTKNVIRNSPHFIPAKPNCIHGIVRSLM